MVAGVYRFGSCWSYGFGDDAYVGNGYADRLDDELARELLSIGVISGVSTGEKYEPSVRSGEEAKF